MDPDASLSRFDLDRWPRSTEAWLIDNGWLTKVSPTTEGASIQCPECEEEHSATVVRMTVNGQSVWMAECDNLGAVSIADADLHRWRPSPSVFMRAVKDGLRMFAYAEQVLIPDQLWVIGHERFSSTALRVIVACGPADLGHVPTHSGPTAVIHFGVPVSKPTEADIRLVDGSLMLDWAGAEGVTFSPDVMHKIYPSATWPTENPRNEFLDPNILFIEGIRYELPRGLTEMEKALFSAIAPHKTIKVSQVMRMVWKDSTPNHKKHLIPRKLSKLLGEVRSKLQDANPCPRFTYSQQNKEGALPIVYRKALADKELGDAKIHRHSPPGRK